VAIRSISTELSAESAKIADEIKLHLKNPLDSIVNQQKITNMLLQQLLQQLGGAPQVPPGITPPEEVTNLIPGTMLNPSTPQEIVQLTAGSYATDPFTVQIGNTKSVIVSEASVSRLYSIITNISTVVVYLGFTVKVGAKGMSNEGFPMSPITGTNVRGDSLIIDQYVGNIYAITDAGNNGNLQVQEVFSVPT